MNDDAQVGGRLETTSHPDSTGQPWRLSDAAIDQLVEQLPGKTVTANFDPAKPVGTVIEAKRDDSGVAIVVSVSADSPLCEDPTFGPSFRAIAATDRGTFRDIDALDVEDVGVIPEQLPGASVNEPGLATCFTPWGEVHGPNAFMAHKVLEALDGPMDIQVTHTSGRTVAGRLTRLDDSGVHIQGENGVPHRFEWDAIRDVSRREAM